MLDLGRIEHNIKGRVADASSGYCARDDREIIFDLIAELRRLRKIESQLPKTADGVVITDPSTGVFCIEGHLTVAYSKNPGWPKRYCNTIKHTGGCVELEWSECYSTTEAAQAARERNVTCDPT